MSRALCLEIQLKRQVFNIYQLYSRTRAATNIEAHCLVLCDHLEVGKGCLGKTEDKNQSCDLNLPGRDEVYGKSCRQMEQHEEKCESVRCVEVTTND